MLNILKRTKERISEFNDKRTAESLERTAESLIREAESHHESSNFSDVIELRPEIERIHKEISLRRDEPELDVDLIILNSLLADSYYQIGNKALSEKNAIFDRYKTNNDPGEIVSAVALTDVAEENYRNAREIRSRTTPEGIPRQLKEVNLDKAIENLESVRSELINHATTNPAYQSRPEDYHPAHQRIKKAISRRNETNELYRSGNFSDAAEKYPEVESEYETENTKLWIPEDFREYNLTDLYVPWAVSEFILGHKNRSAESASLEGSNDDETASILAGKLDSLKHYRKVIEVCDNGISKIFTPQRLERLEQLRKSAEKSGSRVYYKEDEKDVIRLEALERIEWLRELAGQEIERTESTYLELVRKDPDDQRSKTDVVFTVDGVSLINEANIPYVSGAPSDAIEKFFKHPSDARSVEDLFSLINEADIACLSGNLSDAIEKSQEAKIRYGDIKQLFFKNERKQILEKLLATEGSSCFRLGEKARLAGNAILNRSNTNNDQDEIASRRFGLTHSESLISNDDKDEIASALACYRDALKHYEKFIELCDDPSLGNSLSDQLPRVILETYGYGTREFEGENPQDRLLRVQLLREFESNIERIRNTYGVCVRMLTKPDDQNTVENIASLLYDMNRDYVSRNNSDAIKKFKEARSIHVDQKIDMLLLKHERDDYFVKLVHPSAHAFLNLAKEQRLAGDYDSARYCLNQATDLHTSSIELGVPLPEPGKFKARIEEQRRLIGSRRTYNSDQSLGEVDSVSDVEREFPGFRSSGGESFATGMTKSSVNNYWKGGGKSSRTPRQYHKIPTRTGRR